MTPSAPMVATFPLLTGQNPYQSLLLEALRARGVRLAGEGGGLKPRWVRGAAAAGVDAVHLHWLEFLYSAEGTGPVSAALVHKRAAALMRALDELRRSRIRVVWTVHNLRPHETRFPRLADAAIRAGLRAADALVVHSEHAARRLDEAFSPGRAPLVLPHPNYAGAYPPERLGRARRRRELDLDEQAFVHLMFGQIRPYKRVPEAIAAFARVEDRRARLVMSGGVSDPSLEREIRGRAGRDDRVRLALGPVADEDVADLHAAADSALLHYRDVFSSGALMLALTFGLPIVAPAGSTADELVRPPALEAYAGDDPAPALARVAMGDQAARRAAALHTAAAHPWSAMADGLIRLFDRSP